MSVYFKLEYFQKYYSSDNKIRKDDNLMIKTACHVQTWGDMSCSAKAVDSIKDAYYLSGVNLDLPLKDISDVGYQGFELFDGDLMIYKDNPNKFISLTEKYDLKPLGVYTAGNFIYPDVLAEELHKIEQIAKVAKKTEVQFLVIGGNAVPSGGLKEDHLEHFAKALNNINNICDSYDISASFHPHITKSYTIERNKTIIDKSNIPLCPDTGVLKAGGVDPVRFINEYYDRINHVHFKDDREGYGVELGTGQVDFVKVLKVLIDKGYSKWITNELDDTYLDLKESAWAHSSYLKGLLDSFGFEKSFNKQKLY